MRAVRKMPVRLLPALLASLVSTAALSQIGLHDGPMIRFGERQVDFGEVSEGTPVFHDFEFNNAGTEPLVISRVESTCGCTAAAPTDSLLYPGDAASVRVTFDGKDLNGDVTKIVAIYTNDPAEPRIDLVLKASVTPLIRFENERLNFAMVPIGQTRTLSTLITADAGLGFGIDRIEGGDTRVDWKVIPASSNGGDSYRIEARLKEDAELGRFNERILLHIRHPQTKVVRMGIRGTVYSCFVPDEPGIRFGTVGAGKRVTRKLAIQRVGDQPYEITGAESTLDFLVPTIDVTEQGYVLSIELDTTISGVEKGGRIPFREVIRLRTTDPAQEQLDIQVRGVVRG